MAQQIQFIYLTQSDYDGLTPQTSKIYFTSDTKRIYKGVDLYAATTFDQLNFSTISASGIFVNGSAVSLEGHSHSMSDISGLDSAISAATSNFATWGHQHAIADVTNLPGIVSGITTTGITKSDGNFTNLNATSIQASAMNVTGAGTFSSVSASTATFGNLVVTGDVSMTLSQVTFGSIMASDIQVDGTSVALVGHTHTMSDIEDLDIPEGIWESGEETDSARRIITESTPVVTGSESTVISQGALTTGVANIAGLKGYRYTNTGNVTNSLTFETAPSGWAAGDVVSIINADNYPDCATIASISGTTVTFSENLPFSSVETDTGWDAKTAYVIAKPNIGDVDIGYAAYAEGLGTKALNVAAHAEGRQT